jgi:hypothetical protein
MRVTGPTGICDKHSEDVHTLLTGGISETVPSMNGKHSIEKRRLSMLPTEPILP